LRRWLCFCQDVLISLAAYDSFEFDRTTETITIGAGQVWGEVDRKMEEFAPGYAGCGAPNLSLRQSLLSFCLAIVRDALTLELGVQYLLAASHGSARDMVSPLIPRICSMHRSSRLTAKLFGLQQNPTGVERRWSRLRG